MENEFVPYEEALALKELGFDEPCYEYFTVSKDGFRTKTGGIPPMGYNFIEKFKVKEEGFKVIVRPLYQQAFRWFREKGYHNGIVPIFDYHYYIIKDFNKDKEYNSEYDDVSYEEAELACLKKLIEIVKQNKDE